jgi:hypothetical protein
VAPDGGALLDAFPEVAEPGEPDGSRDGTAPVAVVLETTGGGRGAIASPGLIDCSAKCAVDVPQGATVVVTATADPASTFMGWGADALDCGNQSFCSLTASKPLRIVAEFQRNVQLTVSVDGRGQVTSTAGTGAIACPGTCGDTAVLPASISLHAEPGVGWLFDRWSGACSGSGQDCNLELGADAPTQVSTGADFKQMYNWAQQIGGWPYWGLDIAAGSTGEVAVVGDHSLGKFDGGAFVMAFSPTGALRYWKTFQAGNGGHYVTAEAVSFDPDGNAVVAGMFRGTIDLGGGPLVSAGEYDLFLAAFTPNGAHLSSRRWGDAEWQQPRALEVSHDGAMVVGGTFAGKLSFGATLLTSAGRKDAFAAKLNPDGSEIWATRWGGEGDETILRVLPLADGGAALLGVFEETQMTLIRLDASGSQVWAQDLPGAEPGQLRDFAGSGLGQIPSGDLIVSTMDSTTKRSYISRFSPDGTLLAEKTFAETEVLDVAVDSAGDVVVVGVAHEGGGLGGPPLPVCGALDVLVGKLDSDFAPRWSFAFGDEYSILHRASRVTIDAANNILFFGENATTLDLGPGPMSPSPYSSSMYLASFRP